MTDWTEENIAKLDTDKIKSLRENAVRASKQQIVELCDAEILRRKPPKPTKQPTNLEDRKGHYVSEFHFVCPNESEVKKDSSGLVRSGTWVVSEANAEAAVRYGSLIALHTAKAEPSYLQGKIKSWTKQARMPKNAEGELVKNESGIEFQFEPTNTQLSWKGDGAGEKGYAWAQVPNPV